MKYTSDEFPIEWLQNTGPVLDAVYSDSTSKEYKGSSKIVGKRDSMDMVLSPLQALRVRLGLEKPPDSSNQSIDGVLSDLFSPQWPTRVEAVRTLELLGKHTPSRALRALAGALHDENEYVRAAAAQVLGGLGAHAPRTPLLLASGDRDAWSVRASVVQALGRLEKDVPRETLMRALEDEDPSVRAAAVSALGRLSKGPPIEPLMHTLQDEDFFVRLASVKTLASFGQQVPMGVLVSALQDEDEDVRLEALEALAKFGERVPIEPLVTVLQDEDEDIRTTAVRVLGGLGEHVPFEPLVLALKDVSEKVQTEASRILGRFGEQLPRRVSLGFLLQCMQDSDEQIRAVAAWALGERREQMAVDPLVQALDDESEIVRSAAAWSLGELSGSAIAEPFAMLPGESLEERSVIVRLLGTLTDFLEDKKGFVHPALLRTSTGRVLVLLCCYQHEGRSLQEAVLSALESSTPVERLEAALNDRDEAVRAVAAQVLERVEKRSWTELCIVSLELLQDARILERVKVPTKIVLCNISYNRVRDSDTHVLRQIMDAFVKESVCKYSWELKAQSQREKMEWGNNSGMYLHHGDSSLGEMKPDPYLLGSVLKGFRLWYEVPSQSL